MRVSLGFWSLFEREVTYLRERKDWKTAKR
jgi:hypothetical protein